jgi:hypothetical protein
MFCDAPFCDLPFTSYFEILVSNGEIFYFDADIQQLLTFTFEVAQSGTIELCIQQSNSFIAEIQQSEDIDLNIQKDPGFDILR